MEEVQKIIYKTFDGQIFEDKTVAEKHELALKKEAENTTYWRLSYKPDLTEGRGYYGTFHIKIVGFSKTNHKMYLEDWCYEKLGRRVALIMGCAPIENWNIYESTIEKFTACVGGSVGDYAYSASQRVLKPAESMRHLIEESL